MKKIYLTLGLFLAVLSISAQNEFITTWDLSKPNGTGTVAQVQFFAQTSGTVNYSVTITAGAGSNSTGSFTSGTVTIPISGGTATTQFTLTVGTGGTQANLQRFYFNLNLDRQQITAVTQWGTAPWTSMNTAYSGCVNLSSVSTTDAPVLSGVTDCSSMFRNCSVLNAGSFNTWNTATVTNMSLMFYSAIAFNQNIGSWNTAAVTNMSSMFESATAFNQNIGSWNTAAVTNMSSMFRSAPAFNQNIGSWNTAAVTNMSLMFLGASAFNQNIGSWNTAAVTAMNSMFQSATAFNQNIGSWNTAAVTNMSQMFQSATAFNQNIGSWNTAAVTNMSNMFNSASAFNQNIGSWNTAAVTTMASMFNSASVFNQDLSAWNVSSVTTFNSMFYHAFAYANLGVSLSNWNPVAATDLAHMFNWTIYNMPLSGNWCGTTLVGVTTMSAMFSNNNVFNQDISCWNVSTVTNFSYMFGSTNVFGLGGISSVFNNGGQPLSAWNVSAATTMQGMFNITTAFNQDISAWNVSSVADFSLMFNSASAYTNLGVSLNTWNPVAATNMSSMFAGTCKYNMPLNSSPNWTTSLNGVTNMSNMFGSNSVFNQDISGWDVSTVTNFSSMFYLSAFTNNGVSLSSWNPAAALDMSSMFRQASYNLPLSGNWCGSTLNGVTTMASMFSSNPVFNQDISCWDVSTVQNFSNMFGQNSFAPFSVFNNDGQPLPWNTAAATNMSTMFVNNKTFNQDVSGWNTNLVTNMFRMFSGASAFNHSLATLPIPLVSDLTEMLNGTGMSQANYDATLIAWETTTKLNGRTLGASGLKFCAAVNARNNMVANSGWTFSGDALGCAPGGVVGTSLRFWQKPNTQGGTNGNPVSTGYDWSGNNYFFDQGTAANQPTYSTANTINFNPTWQFDGVNDYLSSSQNISYSATNYSVSGGNRSASSSSGSFTADKSSLAPGPSWQPASASNTEYLTLDLGLVRPVYGITTRGDFTSGSNKWTTSYTVYYSTDNISYTQIGGTYTGNTNQGAQVSNDFPNYVAARYIRIYPQTWNTYPALCTDVYHKANTAATVLVVTKENARQNNVLLNLGYTDVDNQFTLSSVDGSGNALFKGIVGGAPALSSFSLSAANSAAVGTPSMVSATQLSTGSSYIYIDGKRVATSTGAIVPNGSMTMGGLSTGSSFSGGIGEVITYGLEYSGLNLLRIHSYVALKFGLNKSADLNGNASLNEVVSGSIREGDYVASDGSTIMWTYSAASAGYNNNIFGIGRDDNEGLAQRISTSQVAGDILILSTDNNYTGLSSTHTAFAGDKSFIVIGNNGTNTVATQSSDMPASTCGYRASREWRVQVKGTAQNVNLRVDASTYSTLLSGAALADIILLIDQDGDGNFTTGTPREVAATSYSSGIISFEGFKFDTDASGSDVFTIARRYQPVASLANNGEVISAVASCGKISGSTSGYQYYRDPASDTRGMLSYDANGNTSFAPTTVLVDNLGTYSASYPGGTFTNAATNPYYQMTNGTSTIRISRRITSIKASGIYNTNGGIKVRIYYDPAENTAMINDPFPGGLSSTNYGWFKVKTNTPDSVIKYMGPEYLTAPMEVTELTPSASGTEDGIDWVEFTTSSFSSFGFFSKTDFTPLPVQLLSFKANCANGKTLIKWQTAQEINSGHFEVEKSTDGIRWIMLDKLAAAGNSYQLLSYSFTDNTNSEAGVSTYYRLKMVDHNGSSEYSKMVVTHCTKTALPLIQIYPNPVDNEINIQSAEEIGEIQLLSIEGKLLFTQSVMNTQTSLQMASLASGIYILRVDGQSFKLVKN